MKAKMYKYIFSILLVCFAAIGKAQTIDGKLYTPFNNYYQWIGGKFNSNLNIPKVAATTGRDTGGIRYNLADSSMYIWTGSQWRQVGGSTPTLQQVTTAGNTTNNDIYINNSAGSTRFAMYKTLDQSVFEMYGTAPTTIELLVLDSAIIKLGATSIKENDRNTIDNVYLPDSSGTLTQRITINGTTYNTTANGVVDLGNTDTATVVKAYVTNAEAVTITKGQVVYIFGAQGDRAAVKLAKNTSDTFSSKTLGIVRADIASGQAGWVTTQGQVSGINLGAYTAGDILWLDSVAGGFTKTKPVAPYHSVFVGVVERANAGNGLIYVKPQNGQELGELHDTKITSPTNNQVLAYTASTDIWENKSVATALGYTPLNVTDTTTMLSPYLRSNVAAATYQLIGSYLTSITAPSGAGINLIKGTSQVKRLKAGSGISITDNTDSVTITNVGAVNWQSADTLYAYNRVRNGRHIMADFEYRGQNNQAAGWGDASEFISLSGTNADFNSGGINAIRLTTAGVGSQGLLTQGQASIKPMSFIDANDPAVVNFRIKPNDLYDATDRFFFQIGLIDAGATNIANGYYFVYDKGQSQTGSTASDNWQCVTANASTRTWTNTSTAVTEDVWLTLSIRITTGKVIFYVNGSIVAEHTTNITTANTAIVTRMIKPAGSNSRTCDVDYITFDQWYSTLR